METIFFSSNESHYKKNYGIGPNHEEGSRNLLQRPNNQPSFHLIVLD